MKKTTLLLTGILLMLVSCRHPLTSYVNPFVGTGAHGHTFPGAIVPFGAVQLSPDTRLDGWDGCSGYHYDDSVIYGFSHTHLSGTGCSDYGDILVMPFVGTGSPINNKYCSHFSHSDENASPGYYSVKLSNGVFAEMTTTSHVGCHRYTFPDDGQRHGIVIDIAHRDIVLDSYIKIIDNQEVVGSRISRAWNEKQHIYFDMKFSSPLKTVELYRDSTLITGTDNLQGGNIKAVAYFDDNVRQVVINVGISAVDIEGAQANMAEMPTFDFDKVKKNADEIWNKELGKIEVKGGENDMRKFYTALYHCFTAPYEYSDIDKRYRGQDGEIHRDEKHKVYTVFSLWDTYRALHPLLNIIDRERTNDFLNTFLLAYEQGGQLPVWELSAYETWCMIGYHSVPVILDASRKGIGDFDKHKMLKAMVASAELPKLGRPEFEQYEYIPADKEHESVSKTLEYCFDDWCIAEFAKDLGETETANRFYRRSQFYKNLIDADGFAHPRSNGGFIYPFSPGEVNNHYTEANSWQYSTYVPHDFAHYVQLAGGIERIGQLLDSLFFGKNNMSGRQQADLTGVMGNYAHGNEPGHHAPYMYNYVGQPEKTQNVVRRILTEQYADAPDGLCGNEDCGQMSAWYVMSAMGFYAVAPGSNSYDIGSPIFDEVKIHLENGKTFTLICKNQSKENAYIQSITGCKTTDGILSEGITYDMISNGETIKIEMGPQPRTTDNVTTRKAVSVPASLTLAPVFEPNGQVFRDNISVKILNTHPQSDESGEIFYSISDDDFKSVNRYSEPLNLTETTTIRAWAEHPTFGRSSVVEAVFHKFAQDKAVKINGKYNPQYTAGGDEGLIDGLRGYVNWRLGGWQGYQSQDFEAVVDLKSVKKISEVSVGFLEDIRAWIWYPTKLIVEVSVDGEKFVPFGEYKNPRPDNDYTVKAEDFTVNGKAAARYVRVHATNYGVLPVWHLGAGGDAFIFVDEIIVK